MRNLPILLGALLLSPAIAHAFPGVPTTPRHSQPRELLVKFAAGVDATSRAAALTRHNVRLTKTLTADGLVRTEVPEGLSVDAAAARLNATAGVEYSQPNYIYRISAVPNDPSFASQWGLANTGQTVSSAPYTTHNPGTAGDDIGAAAAWDHITDCSAVTVAVVDTGVNYNHDDLNGSLWDGGTTYPHHGYDFVDGDNDPMDLEGHGSHVAGIIGARGNNGVGSTGVCWKAKIMAVRVMDAGGTGTTADIISGINFAVANGAKVINLSLGQSAYDSALGTAVQNASAAGVVVVAAAGNDGANNDLAASPVYPCNYTSANLVCVAALDQSFALASFSNYGATSVDIGAPGTNIVSLNTGTFSTITDDFTTAWTSNDGTWAGGSRTLSDGNAYAMMMNPSTWNHTSARYANNLDARVYKDFNLNGVDSASLSFLAFLDTQSSADYFSVAFRPSTGDPFASGTLIDHRSGTTGGQTDNFSYDLNACRVSPCSVGFRLTSDASTVSYGVAVLYFELKTLALDTHSYQTLSGTSMATPMVSGVAAMLLAFNPSYTAADVVASLKNGGPTLGSLVGKTTTTRGLSAIGSLQYINAPTNVRVGP